MLPLSAALAGRMAGRRLLSPRLAPVTAAVLAGYVLSLATVFSAPSAPPSNARLARWLLAHHLDYGLGSYGTGNATTLDTGNQVHVAAVVFHRGRCYPPPWPGRQGRRRRRAGRWRRLPPAAVPMPPWVHERYVHGRNTRFRTAGGHGRMSAGTPRLRTRSRRLPDSYIRPYAICLIQSFIS